MLKERCFLVKAYTTMLRNMHHLWNSICGFFCYRLLTKYVNTATTQSMATAKFHGVMKSVINAKVQHHSCQQASKWGSETATWLACCLFKPSSYLCKLSCYLVGLAAGFERRLDLLVDNCVQHQDQGGTCDGRGRSPAATSQQAAGPADRIECCRLTTCAPLHTYRHYLSGSVHQLTHVHDHVSIEQALHAVTNKIYEAWITRSVKWLASSYSMSQAPSKMSPTHACSMAYEKDEWTRRHLSGSQVSSAISVLSKTRNNVWDGPKIFSGVRDARLNEGSQSRKIRNTVSKFSWLCSVIRTLKSWQFISSLTTFSTTPLIRFSKRLNPPANLSNNRRKSNLEERCRCTLSQTWTKTHVGSANIETLHAGYILRNKQASKREAHMFACLQI
jgi:hypothetical protein